MEYNLRERAEIVALAIQASQELKAQPLIDWFEQKMIITDHKAEEWLEYKTGLMNELGYNEEEAIRQANHHFGDQGKF